MPADGTPEYTALSRGFAGPPSLHSGMCSKKCTRVPNPCPWLPAGSQRCSKELAFGPAISLPCLFSLPCLCKARAARGELLGAACGPAPPGEVWGEARCGWHPSCAPAGPQPTQVHLGFMALEAIEGGKFLRYARALSLWGLPF